MDCKRVEENLPLYFYDELGGEPRAEMEAHLAACPRCAATAEELRRLSAALAARPVAEPSPDLLARCRYELEEALDRETTGWRALVRSGFGLWPMGSPLRATAALAILLAGFSLGWAMRQQAATPAPGQGNGVSPWMGADLSNMRINGISRVTPDPQTGEVHITLDAERRLTLEGSLDDARIQQVLLYAMKSYDNPGIRRDTLEVLSQHGGNPNVRAALLYALRNDPNDGVRLEALQAVDELASNSMRHAYGMGIPGAIRVELSQERSQVRLMLEDDGRPFRGTVGRSLDLARGADVQQGGLGLALTFRLVNELRYERIASANRWTVVLDLASPPRTTSKELIPV